MGEKTPSDEVEDKGDVDQKKEKKENHQDGNEKQEKEEGKTKYNRKKDGDGTGRGGKEEEKKKKPEYRKDPAKLRKKLGKIDSEMQADWRRRKKKFRKRKPMKIN